MGVKTSNYQIGISSTNTQNFNLRTGLDGTLRLYRGDEIVEIEEVLRIDASGNLSLLGNISSGVFGAGQSWQDMAGQRVFGVTYTNTTGKPICLSVRGTSNASAAIQVTVAGIPILGITLAAGNILASQTVPIPVGATYSVNVSAGTGVLTSWAEMR